MIGPTRKNTGEERPMSVFAELKNKAFYAKTVHIMVPVLVQQIISVGIGFFDNVMIGKFGESQISVARKEKKTPSLHSNPSLIS